VKHALSISNFIYIFLSIVLLGAVVIVSWKDISFYIFKADILMGPNGPLLRLLVTLNILSVVILALFFIIPYLFSEEV
jgi:hypothetical protein